MSKKSKKTSADKGRKAKLRATKSETGKVESTNASKRSRRDDSGSPELSGRAAARALKEALRNSDENPSLSSSGRRRRPPTSHGPIPAPLSPPRALTVPEALGFAPPRFFYRHDIAVLLFGLFVLAAGLLFERVLASPGTHGFDRFGLSFARPAIFLPAATVDEMPTAKTADGTSLPFHVNFHSAQDPTLRVEVLIDERPSFNNLRATRALDRANQYGALVWLDHSKDVNIQGRSWLRSELRYASVAGIFAEPRVANAVELAILNGSLVYVVTLHGDEQSALELADAVLPSLSTNANHPAAAGEVTEL